MKPFDPQAGAKAIYVLDGQAQFETVADALNALDQPGVFSRFIAIDPNMWWDNSRLVTEATVRLRRSFASTAVFR